MTVNQCLSSIRLWFGGIKSVKTANIIITWILEYALTGIQCDECTKLSF